MKELTLYGMTAAEHREAAKASRARSVESFERCDTDGFLSQWAGDLSAKEHLENAAILDADGFSEFWGLYEGDRRVKAACVSVYDKFKHGNVSKWVVEDDDPICAQRKWIPSGDNSRVQKGLGLKERREMAPARAKITGDGGNVWVGTFRTGCRYGSNARLSGDEADGA
tara:strand:+ start:132 stop:638 length:507 start_codon:yes stop_codon:yes gene_type:complete